jgi:hypothetical protein
MEITNARQATPGRVRTVLPLGETDPDFKVELIELSDSEQAAIFDRHNYSPGSRSATVAKLNKVTRDIVKKRIVSFEGLTEHGVELDVTDANKLKFLSTEVEYDGETKVLWQLVVEAEETQKAEEVKNSPRS